MTVLSSRMPWVLPFLVIVAVIPGHAFSRGPGNSRFRVRRSATPRNDGRDYWRVVPMQVVMPGLVPDKPGHDGEDVPVIHVLALAPLEGRGWPGDRRETKLLRLVPPRRMKNPPLLTTSPFPGEVTRHCSTLMPGHLD